MLLLEITRGKPDAFYQQCRNVNKQLSKKKMMNTRHQTDLFKKTKNVFHGRREAVRQRSSFTTDVVFDFNSCHVVNPKRKTRLHRKVPCTKNESIMVR